MVSVPVFECQWGKNVLGGAGPATVQAVESRVTAQAR